MRYIKVFLAIVFFYFVMLFFVQNQAALSQTMPLKLDLMLLPPMQSPPLSFYMLALICFLLGGVFTLATLLWDRLMLSAHLGSSRRRIKAMEKELTKSSEALESLKKELEQTVTRAGEAESKAALAERAADKACNASATSANAPRQE